MTLYLNDCLLDMYEMVSTLGIWETSLIIKIDMHVCNVSSLPYKLRWIIYKTIEMSTKLLDASPSYSCCKRMRALYTDDYE
jgi:hypothetical protein